MLKKIKTSVDTQVLIGQPKYYPHDLVFILIEYFTLNSEIKKAYLGCIQYPNTSDGIKILICIDTNADIYKIISMMSEKLDSIFMKSNVDFIDFNESQFKNYFSKIKPFYERNDAI